MGSPVSPAPAVKKILACRSAPIEFSLSGDQGLIIVVAG